MIEEKIKQIIAEMVECSPEELQDTSGILTQYGWDSLAHIGIITSIEETFNITIDDTTIGQLLTIKDLVSYVKEHIKGDAI